MIIGKSGSGKSCAMRTLDPEQVALINVLGKPLPFKGQLASYVNDDYGKVIGAIKTTKRPIVVVDDAGYLMTNMFMRGHTQAGGGNGVFALYNNIGDKFWSLIETVQQLPGDQRVYIMMHEDVNDFGIVKPKSIGKMVDEKVCLEGMFAICLRAMVSNGKHIFRTQSDGMDVAKSPLGMFPTDEIDNDLNYVDKSICQYYEIGGAKSEATK